MQWQPIETAPKDGTEMLAYMKTSCGSIKYMSIIYWGKILKKERKHYWIDLYSDKVIDTPTHWMPLPKSPEQ